MSALRTLSSRPQLRAAAVALLLLASLALVLATPAPTAAAVLALAVAAVVALAGAGALAARPGSARATRPAAAPAGEAAPALRLTLPDGETLSARPVPLPGHSSEQLLLTRDGYVVVDGEGRVLHRL